MSEQVNARRATGWAIVNVIVVLYALFPVLWILSLSLKPTSMVKDGKLIPSEITFENYKAIFEGNIFTSALVNSIGIGLITTLIAVVIGGMAAYAIARLAFPGKKVLVGVALLLMAGLALVPEDLLKAASMDGANAWKRFWMITVPLIKPAILVALLFRTLDAFRIFDNIYVLTGGANDTGSVSILGYDNLFKAFNLGLGSAISVLIFLCVAIIAFVFIKVFGAAAPGSDEEGR